MRIVVGDLWAPGHIWRVIPTNLTVTRDGKAVMGRGVAAQAADIWVDLPRIYGEHVSEFGDVPMADSFRYLILLPVKYNYWETADVQLIETGLKWVTSYRVRGEIYMPLLGGGFGELNPVVALTLMAKELPLDSFVLVLKDETVVKKYPQSFRKGARIDRTP